MKPVRSGGENVDALRELQSKSGDASQVAHAATEFSCQRLQKRVLN